MVIVCHRRIPTLITFHYIRSRVRLTSCYVLLSRGLSDMHKEPNPDFC